MTCGEHYASRRLRAEALMAAAMNGFYGLPTSAKGLTTLTP